MSEPSPITCPKCKTVAPFRPAETERSKGQGRISWRMLRCTSCGKVRGVEATSP